MSSTEQLFQDEVQLAVCELCDKEFKAEAGARGWGTADAKLRTHMRQAHGVGAKAKPAGLPHEVVDIGEEPPKRRGFFSKLWKNKEDAPAGEIRPRKPKPARSKRTSLAPVGTLLWTGASWQAAQMGEVPTSRIFSVQAPIAGDVLDRAIAGSVVDKLIQPLMGDADRWTEIASLLAFPILGLVHTHKPTAATDAALRLVIRQNLVALAGALKKAKKEADQLSAVVEELDTAGLELGDDPIATMMKLIFGEPAPAGEPSNNGVAQEVNIG